MAKTLDVYLFGSLAGHLVQDDGGQMVFDYAESWTKTPNACPLSHSLPLRAERFSRKACRGFFAGILPEENQREIIARNLGISARNDYAMLERIGGECAGAVPESRENSSPDPSSTQLQPIRKTPPNSCKLLSTTDGNQPCQLTLCNYCI